METGVKQLIQSDEVTPVLGQIARPDSRKPTREAFGLAAACLGLGVQIDRSSHVLTPAGGNPKPPA